MAARGFVCEVDGAYRSACIGLGVYDDYEDKHYCVLHYPGKEKRKHFEEVKKSKLAGKDYDFAGTIFPEGTSNFQSFEFDANADFAGATFIRDTHFLGARFSGEKTSFSGAHFSGEETSFREAQFSGAQTLFAMAHFSSKWTIFWEVYFSGELTSFLEAHFNGELTTFRGAKFSSDRTDFTGAQFSSDGTVFSGARFGSTEIYFGDATFTQEVVFHGATFREKATFLGSKANTVFGSGAWARFNRCRIEKPEQFIFNTVLLHPGWFCNTDVRKADFTDVKWYGMPGGPKGTLDEEINALKARNVGSPHSLLAQACRRLSANAEENREYPLANEFHYWSMDALRKESWDYLIWIREWISKSGLRVARRCGLATTLRLVWSRIRRRRQSRPRSRFGLINTLYWSLSGYGVRARRALGMLLTITLMFAVLYMLVGPSSLQVLPIVGIGQVLADTGQAVMYSVGVLARLRPEPIPKEMGLFQILVTIEGILGPLQIALLALAARRVVMR